MEWRDIVGFEGVYQVSEYGQFRRIWPSGVKEKAQQSDRAGYLSAKLYKNGKGRRVWAAIAVAEAFVGKRPAGYEVCHKDNNNQNNHFSNLRYDTPLNNRRDKVQHATAKNQHTKTHCRNGHPWSKETTRTFGSNKQRVCKCGSI